jgi:hypothetical protein
MTAPTPITSKSSIFHDHTMGLGTVRRYVLGYASLGLAVAPCFEIGPDGLCTCPAGAACDSPGKHPRTPHGLLDASTDPRQIDYWLRRYQTANWLLTTGAKSGIDALDSDPRHVGDETLKHIERAYGPLPITVTATTGSGGEHRFFRHHRGLRNSAGRLGPGVDVRGEGGYVIVAPSNHVSGGRYRWQPGRAPGEIPLAPWPADLVAALVVPERPQVPTFPKPAGVTCVVPDSLLRWAERGAPLGRQTSCAFWLACRLRQYGASEQDGMRVMETFASNCIPLANLSKITRIWHDSTKYQGFDPARRLDHTPFRAGPRI